MRVPAVPSSIAFVRRTMTSMVETCGQETADTLALIFTELVTNSIRHADVRANDTIEVSLDVEPDALRGAVMDRGSGFAHTTEEQREEVYPPSGGLGLLMVSRLSRRWGVRSAADTTEVWFEL